MKETHLSSSGGCRLVGNTGSLSELADVRGGHLHVLTVTGCMVERGQRREPLCPSGRGTEKGLRGVAFGLSLEAFRVYRQNIEGKTFQ